MSTPEPFPGHVVSSDGSTGAPGSPEATPAATTLVLRDGRSGLEVLMLRRRRGGAFSGMWVFPGGKVEPGDESPADADPEAARLQEAGLGDVAGEIAVARRAAVREAAEEARLVLAPADLVVHSWWIPPPEAPRRFSTWFFVAPVGSSGEVVVDDTEVHEYRWVRPGEAREARDAGTLPLAPPTWMSLLQVDGHDDVGAVLAEAASRPPIRFETRFARGPEGTATVWSGDPAYESGDLAAPGPRRRLWVSDEGPWRAELTHGPAGPS